MRAPNARYLTFLRTLEDRRHQDGILGRPTAAMSSSLRRPLLDDEPREDQFMWVRLIATVVSVSLGSSLQFGFATGSLNNLEQVCQSSMPSLPPTCPS